MDVVKKVITKDQGSRPIQSDSTFTAMVESITREVANLSRSGGGNAKLSQVQAKIGIAGTNNESICPSLSWETRIKGFFICLFIGVALSVIGSITLFFQNYTAFGILYTFGTITALCSTLFLRGPMAQLKGMFKETRLIATLVLLLMMILTILSAAVWHKAILALLFCVFQFLAFTWYSLSYIPFARDAVKKCCESCIS